MHGFWHGLATRTGWCPRGTKWEFFAVTKRGARTSLDGGAWHGVCGDAWFLTNVLRGTRHAIAAASMYASATVRGALWVACVEYPGFRFSFRAWHSRRSLCVCVVRVCWRARVRKNCSQVCLALSRKLEHIQACRAGCFAGLLCFSRGSHSSQVCCAPCFCPLLAAKDSGT